MSQPTAPPFIIGTSGLTGTCLRPCPISHTVFFCFYPERPETSFVLLVQRGWCLLLLVRGSEGVHLVWSPLPAAVRAWGGGCQRRLGWRPQPNPRSRISAFSLSLTFGKLLRYHFWWSDILAEETVINYCSVTLLFPDPTPVRTNNHLDSKFF